MMMMTVFYVVDDGDDDCDVGVGDHGDDGDNRGDGDNDDDGGGDSRPPALEPPSGTQVPFL